MDPVQAAFQIPEVRDLVSSIFGRFVGPRYRVAAQGAPARPPPPRRPPPRRPPPRRPPPPRPPPAAQPPDDPREVLGFAQNSRPTKQEIQQRRRKLAGIYHPDAGGNERHMQRINEAADRLLAEIA